MQNQTISFTAPNPYQADLAKIQQQQQLAQLLQQQSMQAPERFSYKGIEARTSPLTGLAKALQGFAAAKMQSDARKEEQALGERYRADRSSDLQTLVEALAAKEGRAALPTEYPSSGTAGGGEVVGLPAVNAKPAGVLDPSVLSTGVFKTPDIENMAVQQYLSQLAPKAPIKGSAGDVFFNPATGAELFRVPEKSDFGQPIREQLPDGSIVTVAYDKAGNRKVIETGNAQPAISTDTAARLKQERELADRAFNNLSAAQQLQERQEAKRLNISLDEYKLRKFQVDNPAFNIVQSGDGYAAVNPRTAVAQPVMVQGAAGGTTPPKQLSAPAKPAPEAYSTKAEALINATDAINQYQKELQGFSNIQALRPDQRARVGNAYQNSLLQLKEIYRLGVLNGPDKAILEQIITNPLDLSSATISTPAMIKQLESMRGILARQNQTLSTVYKQPALQLPTISEAKTSGSATPTSTSGLKFLGFE
jgi:YD repeat-containing protein